MKKKFFFLRKISRCNKISCNKSFQVSFFLWKKKKILFYCISTRSHLIPFNQFKDKNSENSLLKSANALNCWNFWPYLKLVSIHFNPVITINVISPALNPRLSSVRWESRAAAVYPWCCEGSFVPTIVSSDAHFPRWQLKQWRLKRDNIRQHQRWRWHCLLSKPEKNEMKSFNYTFQNNDLI